MPVRAHTFFPAYERSTAGRGPGPRKRGGPVPEEYLGLAAGNRPARRPAGSAAPGGSATIGCAPAMQHDLLCKGRGQQWLAARQVARHGRGGEKRGAEFVLLLVVLLLGPGARRFLAVDESSAHVCACCKPGLLSCPGQWRARVG